MFKPLLIWVCCHSQLYLIQTDTAFNQVLSLQRESIAWAKGRESPLEGDYLLVILLPPGQSNLVSMNIFWPMGIIGPFASVCR